MMNFVFITGAGRCGTNVMRSLIDGHSKLLSTPGELNNYLGQVLRLNGLSGIVNFQLSLESLIRLIKYQYSRELHSQEVKRLLEEHFKSIQERGIRQLSANDFLSEAYKAILSRDKGTVVVNLQNENVSGLLELFPRSKIIHMLRNPLSQLNSRYLYRFSYPRNYHHWEFGENFFRNLNSFRQAEIYQNHSQVHIVRLEDLQRDHQSVMDNVFEFMCLEVELINSKPTTMGRIGVQNTIRGIKKNTTSVLSIEEDWSCLTPNDKYYVSRLSNARSFYSIPCYPFKNNSYWLFLRRHLGFIGKQRKRVKNPLKLFSLLRTSIALYSQDIRSKQLLEIELRE